jgi:F-type H+-transporting ATPase subunit b
MTTTRFSPRRAAAAVAVVAAAVVLVGLGASAYAQTETTPATTTSGDELGKFEAECLEQIEHGGTVDDCHNAPHKFLPERNEIIWGSIFFVVVAVALVKKAGPAAKKAMTARTERIRGEIERAERARASAAESLAEVQALVADSAAERERVLTEAHQQAGALRGELAARAEAEAADVRARAAADARFASERAMAELQTRLARLSVLAAEHVVEHNLDPPTQQALIEQYIDQLAIRRN